MNNILKAIGLDDSSVLRKVISDSFFIDMGIIKEIKEDNEIVTVEMSSASSTADITIVDCVLVCPSSKSISVNIRPTVNDKVIVLFPRRFASEMFNLEKQEPVVSEGVSSYSCMGGIAFLSNQFQEGYKNYIRFDNGKVDIKLAYDKDNDKNLLSIATDENGAVTLANDKATMALDKDGAVTLTNDKATVVLDKDGAVTVTSNTNNVISLDKDGNYEAKNSKGKVNLDKDGYLSYQNTDANNINNPELEFTSSGFTLKDINGCSIESSSSVEEGTKTVINGKLTIKK